MPDTTAPKFIVIPIFIAVTSLLSVLFVAYLIDNGTLPVWNISQYRLVDVTFTMQFMVLPISFVAVGATWLYNKENFKTFFRFSLRSPDKQTDWVVYGPIVAIAFTIGNAMMMSFSVMREHGTVNERFLELLPLVLLLAATNAWSEEIFSRFVIVAGLHRSLTPNAICIVSAAIFGLAHFRGTPSGPFGVIASGVLGWFLARSVVETKSLGWALLIHFLQDIVIFGAGAMIIAGEK